MKKMRACLLAVSFLLGMKSYADSPLTSTFFATAYRDVSIIAEVLDYNAAQPNDSKAMGANHFAFLDRTDIPLDQKIALINAFGYGSITNIGFYKQHLQLKYGLTSMDMDSMLVLRGEDLSEMWPAGFKLSRHDKICLAYTQAMGDYFNPFNAFHLAANGLNEDQTSEAATVVTGLIICQVYMDLDWCSIYQTMQEVAVGIYATDIMRPSAMETILEYTNLYAESCTEMHSTTLEGGNTLEVSMGDRIDWKEDYWKTNPCYPTSASPKTPGKGEKIDLVLLNKSDDNNMIYENWIFYDDQISGTKINLTIQNKGNTSSVPTNIILKVYESEYVKEIIHTEKQLPAIPAGATIQLSFELENFWIFNPNAIFKVVLDGANMNIESDEENNTRDFFEFG